MKLKQLLYLIMYVILIIACKNSSKETLGFEASTMKKVEVQGHRGDRGNFPENSIPAFISALQKGVDVIEMDVVISKDHKVVVSHEPFMSLLYMLHPNGNNISKEEEKSLNLFQMNYDSINQFDSGSGGNKKFPQQKKLKTYKPLLTEVIDTVEAFIEKKKIPAVKYNIEIKSETKEYGKSQPLPEDFVDLVMQVIKEKQIENKMNLQSFDTQVLEIIHKNYPQVEIAYLVSEGDLEENVGKLTFLPQIYSPYYKLISDKSYVEKVHQQQMKLIPWTVNSEEDINNLITLGVDGIITDYPERAMD